MHGFCLLFVLICNYFAMSTIKLISSDIQLLLSAATQINNYKLLVEELIYNALDASASSIAIRINIEDNSLQVVDNGIGILRNDMRFIGLNNYTSKPIEDFTSVKHTYGFKGSSLANIIQVSETVKITSRSKSSDETWCKIFYRGKEKAVTLERTRPSKGTTVEIIGFLYNLNIQKNNLNVMNDIENIKRFLEQLSLVRHDISISLRDDLKNEIIFQLHKSRDIYQTFAVVFGFGKSDILELHVEKKHYKVVAYMGKKISDHSEPHWIYLNGRLLGLCKLHSMIDKILTELFCLRNNDRVAKNKRNNNDEQDLFKKNIPFYFIFIKCPYVDYDVTLSKKQSTIEFKNWDQITKLIEKLTQFYASDKNVIKSDKVIPMTENRNKKDTREQVTEIVQRILASNSKKLGISQMHNGIKGKVQKRKKNKKLKYNNNTLSKLLNPNNNNKSIDKIEPENVLEIPYSCAPVKDFLLEHSPVLLNKIIMKPATKQHKTNINLSSSQKNNIMNVNNDLNDKKIRNKVDVDGKKIQNKNTRVCRKNKIIMSKKVNNKILTSFKNVTNTLKQRCDAISNKVDNVLLKKIKTKHIDDNAFRTTATTTSIENIHQETFLKQSITKTNSEDIESLCVQFQKHDLKRHRFDKKPIYEVKKQVDVFNKDKKTNVYMSSYDLLQTILTQNNKQDFCTQHFTSNNYATVENLPQLTFQSHKRYNIDVTVTTTRQQNVVYNRFITKQSKDNFKSTKKYSDDKQNMNSKLVKPYSKYQKYHTKLYNIHESSYTIEYLNSNNNWETDNNYQMEEDFVISNTTMANKTFTISKNTEFQNTYHLSFVNYYSECLDRHINQTYTLQNTILPSRDVSYVEQTSNAQIDLESSRSSEPHLTTGKNIRDSYSFFENDLNIFEKEKSINRSVQCANSINFVENAESESQNDNLSIDTNATDAYNKSDIDVNNINESQIVVDPITVCETILNSSVRSVTELDPVMETRNHYSNDSLFRNYSKEKITEAMDVSVKDGNYETINETLIKQMESELNDIEQEINTLGSDFSHSNFLEYNALGCEIDKENPSTDKVMKTIYKNGKAITLHKATGMCLASEDKTHDDHETFQLNLDNRPRFVPKGMSPIFKNCNTKYKCNYTFEKDYFEDFVYDDFVKAVQISTEIFEPNIQNLQETASKEINKVNTRIKKDHASLCFSGQNLKDVKVLGQLDNKFIATIMRKSSAETVVTEYLVLFDQHAVHERISLENNMAEYLVDGQWKSINLDEFSVSLKPEEIMYLHNYKDKFHIFGLRWNFVNQQEINVFGIPEAIIGKHVRQVEIIMKAVKSLILEEIAAIKSQKGSICLYPKSIMELVFSEACRYAIKFGDSLSTTDCEELLAGLSQCKTPFQCAHGRPVMAVLLEIEPMNYSYQSDISRIKKFMNMKK